MLTNRKKVLLAAVGSAVLHALVLLMAGFAVMREPAEKRAPEKEEDPFHIQLTKSALPQTVPAPTPEHKVVNSTELTAAATPPPDAAFQSDRDTMAASEEPGTGDKPLPTQKGRVAPVYAFNTTKPSREVQGQSPAAVPETAPVPETVPPLPEPSRAAARPLFEAPAPTRVRNEFTMQDAAPTPPPEEMNPYDPSFRSTAPPLPVPVRRPKPSSAYHPMEERTASSGSITTRGASSVAAMATPFGRYEKAVLDAIRAVWTQEVDARSDIASLGAIKFHFAIDRTGHIHTPEVVSNSANEALASLTLDAINRAAIPPMPSDLVGTMDSAMLQLDVTFECL